MKKGRDGLPLRPDLVYNEKNDFYGGNLCPE